MNFNPIEICSIIVCDIIIHVVLSSISSRFSLNSEVKISELVEIILKI